MKNVDLDEPTAFLDHVHWGCTQRECKPNEIVVAEYTKMFESHVSAGTTEKFRCGRSLTQKQKRGPTTWKDMLENALNESASWHTKNGAALQSINSMP